MLNCPEKTKVSVITNASDVYDIKNIDWEKDYISCFVIKILFAICILAPSEDKKRSVVISSFFMLKNLFYKSSFITQSILGNKIRAIT